MTFTLKTTGLRELAITLHDLPNNIQRRAVTNALVESAEPMAEHAQSLAPQLTGEGARSITASATAKKRVRLKLLPGVFAAFVGPTKHTRQLMDAEFGTTNREHRSGKETGHEPARPFLRPAFDNGWRDVVKRFGPILAVEIKLAFERVYKKVKR